MKKFLMMVAAVLLLVNLALLGALWKQLIGFDILMYG